MKRISQSTYLLGPPVPENKFYVYALYCPIAKQVRYIGSTSGAPLKRYAQHLATGKKGNQQKHEWIAALKAIGQRPYMRVLMVLDNYNDALSWEDCFIVSFQWRRALCNTDKRHTNYSRLPATQAPVLHWFGKRLGLARATDWASLKPDPVRQRLPAALRQTLRSVSASLEGDVDLITLARMQEKHSRTASPDFQRLEVEQLLSKAQTALGLAASLLSQASKY